MLDMVEFMNPSVIYVLQKFDIFLFLAQNFFLFMSVFLISKNMFQNVLTVSPEW